MATGFLALFCLIAVGVVITDSACPIDWALFNSNCYWFSRQVASYPDAASACRMMGGHLVSDDSEAKHNFLYEFLSVFSSMKIKMFWTGGSDFTVEGSWTWIENGGPIGPYVNWGPGQPDGNNTANCMVLRWYNSTLAWADTQCTNAHGHHHTHHAWGHNYICEKSEDSFITA